MLLEVSITEQNKDAIISAIRLIQGVELVEIAEFRDDYDDTLETEEDYQAYLQACAELERGEAIAHEDVEKELERLAKLEQEGKEALESKESENLEQGRAHAL